MGSIGCHRAPGMTDRAFMEQELPNTLTKEGEILACATVSNVFYAAVRTKATNKVWALVVLMYRTRSDGENYCNFTYKDMDESCGPGDHSCPPHVLDLLTPTDHKWATEWRENCRKQAARVAVARQVKPGTKVKFPRAFTFANGDELDTFVFEKRSTFRGPDGYGRYRITNWRRGTFTIVTEEAPSSKVNVQKEHV